MFLNQSKYTESLTISPEKSHYSVCKLPLNTFKKKKKEHMINLCTVAGRLNKYGAFRSIVVAGVWLHQDIPG